MGIGEMHLIILVLVYLCVVHSGSVFCDWDVDVCACEDMCMYVCMNVCNSPKPELCRYIYDILKIGRMIYDLRNKTILM